MTITINEARFLQTIDCSSSIGRTEHGGLDRLTLSEEDRQMRDQFISWLEKDGLAVRVDDFGNIYGRREGKNPSADPITIGSHLDTQPCGGKYDGIIGVLAGLEVLRVLNDHGIETERPIELINFTNEEGARFNPPLMGSGGITSVFTPDDLYPVTDVEGQTFEQALTTIGYKGLKENRLTAARCYVELHIEQGPVLDIEKKDIGIVHGIQGLTRVHVSVLGKTDHAGGARMQDRQDALITAAYMMTAVHELTESIEGLRITIGKIDNFPNVINVISGKVEFVVDVRHEKDELREQAVQEIEQVIQKIANQRKIQVESEKGWSYNMVPFHPELIQLVEEVTNDLGYSSMPIYSGPGHDAKYMSIFTPTTMIFVPSVDGISHNEAEFTSDEHLCKGANILLQVILNIEE